MESKSYRNKLQSVEGNATGGESLLIYSSLISGENVKLSKHGPFGISRNTSDL